VDDDARRADAFARRLLERLSTRVVPFRFGTAYLDADAPRRYDSNFLWVHGADREVPPQRLIEAADDIMGEAGLRHRKALVGDRPTADRLAAPLLEAGWTRDEIVRMVLRRGSDRPAPAPAREVSVEEAQPALEEVRRREPWATDEEVIEMFSAFERKLARVVGARFFVAEADGVPAAVCELYIDGDDAQVESVSTLEEFRGRGLATAVVLAAVDAARASGASWIHLYADADDWPRHWYRTLGFDDVDTFVEFTRLPQNPLPSTV
jgi:ribosomal protein S18 acetylase RimI-like enzyme